MSKNKKPIEFGTNLRKNEAIADIERLTLLKKDISETLYNIENDLEIINDLRGAVKSLALTIDKIQDEFDVKLNDAFTTVRSLSEYITELKNKEE